jgi:hypothetical protein
MQATPTLTPLKQANVPNYRVGTFRSLRSKVSVQLEIIGSVVSLDSAFFITNLPIFSFQKALNHRKAIYT